MFITCYLIVNIKPIEGPLSLSIQFGGLVPGWNLVLVCWEHETVNRHVDNQLVAVGAHSLGALVGVFVAAATATAATATTAVSFGQTACIGHQVLCVLGLLGPVCLG